METIDEAIDWLESNGLRYKESNWKLGHSLFISKEAEREEGGLKILPPTIILAPDDKKWCLVFEWPDKIQRNISSLDEALSIAASKL